MLERFLPNETITRYVDALVEACKPLNRNDVLAHEAIEAILGVPRYGPGWKQCVVKLKRRLEQERGISLWPEVRIGYKLLSKDEQLTMLPAARARRARKQYRLARRSVQSLPDRGLTAHQRRVKQAQLEAMRTAQRHMELNARIMATLSKPVEAMPRRRVG